MGKEPKKLKYYKTEEFKKLQNEWYDKLDNSGFEDLEWLDKDSGFGQNSGFLKKSLKKFNKLTKKDLADKNIYFSLAKDFAQDYKFKSRLHKYIWELYIEGIAYRKMIPKIKSRNFKHVPSIYWISTHLSDIKVDFRKWQMEQPDEEESYDTFLRNNRGSF